MLVFPFGLVYKQVLSFYFVFTVSSTVGFGDIYAMNTSERVIILIVPIMRAAVLKTYSIANPNHLQTKNLLWCQYYVCL